MGCRILIIEDDALQAECLDSLLTSRGHEVCGTARSARMAIRLAEVADPEVIVTDVRLAGLRDGIEAARAIAENREVGVVFHTGETDWRTTERMRALAPAAILSKPASASALSAAVDKAARTRWRTNARSCRNTRRRVSC